MMHTAPTLRLILTFWLFAACSLFVIAQQTAHSSGSEFEGDSYGETFAQESTSVQNQVSAGVAAAAPHEKKSKEKKKKSEKRGSFVVAPLPISSPAIGSGIVPVVGYIFPITRKDKVSPPSVVGAGGLITDNGSRAWGLATQLYFKENGYRATVFYVRGNLNYDLYGSGEFTGFKLPLVQTGEAFQAEFLRRIVWQFFLGPRAITGNSLITVEPNMSKQPLPPDVGLHTQLTGIGFRLIRDTSPNRFYPTSGTYFNFTSDFYSPDWGSKYTLQSYRASFDKYWSLSKSQVLVSDSYGCTTGGKPPFYMNCIYGSSNELRGYVAGKYFDRHMVTTQVEYRLALPYRLGVVGFGGIGEAIPGGDELLFQNNSFLPAGGTGLRLLLSKPYHVNLRSDFAWGKDGHTFTLGVGEAF
ncbi:MAG: BamA/TamA family outer membrane protein [Terracidiphilus sp.]